MLKPFINFKEQVCLITGAGSPTGIGFSAAKILGRLGAAVALVATTDRIYKRAEELKAEGITAKGYIADLMDREQVRKIAEQKMPDLNAASIESAMSMIAGTARSMGIEVVD